MEVALDPEKLADEPLDNATVAVFGSSHSSMIVLPHLLRHPVAKVINFYRSPLKYAVYLDDWILFDDSGLKGRAAVWARENIDGVLSGPSGAVSGRGPEFEEKLAECDRAVYTVGLERRALPETRQWGQLDYNPDNGILAPGLFGVGYCVSGAGDRPLRLRRIPSGPEEVHGPPRRRPAVVVTLPAINSADSLSSIDQRSTSAGSPRRRYTEPNRASMRNHAGSVRTRTISSASTASADCGRKPIAVRANTHRIGHTRR